MIQKISLSGATLKYIAFISMFLDHINKAIIYSYLTGDGILNSISDIFDILGRIAFPIFAFLISEGYFKTRNRKRYLMNLLLFAFISEIPYDMFQSGVFFNFNTSNILFTFSLALVSIWIIDSIKDKMNRYLWIISSIIILIISCIISIIISSDYEYYGILCIYVFYIFKSNKYLSIIFNFPYLLEAPWSILGFGINMLYNGERGKQNKYINYMFYPLHLLLLGIIRMYFMKV